MKIHTPKLEAVHLRDNRWAVRPVGCLGTCGWINGVPWTVCYVNARSEAQAVRAASYR
jgi:hypothetical protein